MPTSPNVDVTGLFHTNWSNTSVGMIASWQTGAVLESVLAFVSMQGPSAGLAVQSVVVPGLTFTRLGGVNDFLTDASNYMGLEVWIAPAASVISANTATVTLNGSANAACAAIPSVKLAYNYLSPFDSNTSVPVSNTHAGSSSDPTATFTTNQPDDLLMFAQAGYSSTAPTGIVGWQNYNNQAIAGASGGGTAVGLGVNYKTVSATQSNLVVSTTTGQTSWITLALALTGDAPPTIQPPTAMPNLRYRFAGATWEG